MKVLIGLAAMQNEAFFYHLWFVEWKKYTLKNLSLWVTRWPNKGVVEMFFKLFLTALKVGWSVLSGGQKLTPAVSARGTNMSHKMA